MSERWEERRSRRVAALEQSAIRAMTRHCEAADGINLGQGICPLPSPPELLEAASNAILADRSTYSKFEGIEALKIQIARKLEAFNGLSIDPDRELVTTVGSAGAFTCTIQALLDEGDEAIVFEPYYGYHLNALRISGVEPQVVTLPPPDWALREEALEAAISERTRAVVVNTPANPSGKVFSRREMELLARFCERHDLLAITDEIYEYMVYGDREHISLATMEGMRDRTVTISGFSKTFAITGWRLGYAAACEKLARRIGMVNDLFYICAPTPLQHGLAEAMAVIGEDYYAGMREKYQGHLERFCDVLEEVGFRPYRPQGSYYILADVASLGCESASDAAMKLLEETGVAAVPGSAFFESEMGERLLRFCVAQSEETIDAAIEGLRRLQVTQEQPR